MNKAKNRIIFAVTMLCMVICTAVSVHASAVQKKSNMDVVLVLDVSGSMKKADPERISLEGAKLFLDMMESTGSRAGIVAFSDHLVQTSDLADIQGITDKTVLKDSINSLNFSGDTDIGSALQKSVDILNSAPDVGNKKMILFFTDGKIDLPKGVPSEAEAEVVSLQATESAVAAAASTQIPVYTIGLNTTGLVDSDLISRISSSTAAKNYIVEDAGDLPAIYNDIFADFVETEINEIGNIKIASEDTYEEKPFHIPNDSVLEANIVMIVKNKGLIKDIQLADPDGNIFIPDNTDLFLSTSNNYNLLKMIAPSAGDWTLKIKGDLGCEIHVNLLFNYDVVLKVDSQPDEDGNLEISAVLEKKDAPVEDPVLYSQLKADINVTREDGEDSVYPMDLSETVFTYTVPVGPGEKITAVVHIEGANMYRDSDPIEYENTTRTPVPEVVQKKDLPSPVELTGFLPFLAKDTLNLDDYFELEDGSALNGSYNVQIKDPDIASSTVDGSQLTLEGKVKGQTRLIIQAEDDQGGALTLETGLSVAPVLSGIIPLLAGTAIVLLLIIVFAFFVVKKALS